MNGQQAQGSRLVRNIRRVLAIAPPRRRLQLFLTVVLTAAGALAELVTIGAVLPLLAIAAAPDRVGTLPILGPILGAIAGALHVTPIIAAALLLIVAAIGATAIRLALSWVSQKFIYGLQQDLVMTVYARALRQPYGWYVQQNSSTLISGLDKIYLVSVGVVSPLLLGMTSGAIAVCIVIFLFVINPVTALLATSTIAVIYLAISLYSRRLIQQTSVRLADARTGRVKTMQETLGGIRDIILDQSQSAFEARMERLENGQRQSLVVVNFLALAPRLIVEGGAILLLAVIAAWFSVQPGGVLNAIPVLGAFALGAQRLLPLIQSVYLGINGYSINAESLNDVADLLETPIESSHALSTDAELRPFARSIELRSAGFAYAGGRAALTGIDLTIRKGERIGLIGKTGSGKSTLADIIMGLLSPTKGTILIDGDPLDDSNIVNWKRQIAHVPQAIFLLDDSIAANIAFGCHEEDVDLARVGEAAGEAGLSELIAMLPEGIDTDVGERGIRLSGGQRQRIGVARALYKRASVLILDEATSALDDQTEAEVMESVDRLHADLTVIIIAHRLSTITRCDRVYRLDKGIIAQQGSVAEVISVAR